ncbi:hypothetical protein METP2_02191 [Methanosarcinales archaeon]|nr:hypothetical protein METP2_02191 [Methanosarcinales archaeon]
MDDFSHNEPDRNFIDHPLFLLLHQLNELENDKTYLDDDDAVRGYLFISFISLYLYYKILNLLRKAKLVDKVSINMVLEPIRKINQYYISE